MESEEMYESLVHNAIDFLDRSISELEENPKYSVIHFYSGVELFLKARLMKEHWILILSDPRNANPTKFRSGDFNSVNLEEVVYRLREIVGVHITENELTVFRRLRDHRNKLIHFFHQDYVKKPDRDTLQIIAAEQCRGWFFLHRFLTKKWQGQFEKFLEQIETLNQMMLENRTFLETKYKELLPSIEKGKLGGKVFSECNYCGFEATTEIEVTEPIFETICLVCDNQENQLRIPCPNCECMISIIELGEGVCKQCNTEINMEFLLERYGEQQGYGSDYLGPSNAYCSNCEYTEERTVVPLDDKWFCLNCFQIYDYLSACESCGERVAGDMEDSYFSGCIVCDGVQIHD